MVRGGCIGVPVLASASGRCRRGSVLFPIFYRSLGADKELLLTWINSNGAAIPLKTYYDTRYSNQLAAAADLAKTRSFFNYDESSAPSIVSQGVNPSNSNSGVF